MTFDLPCLAGHKGTDHDHKCGAPYGHGGPEHRCRECDEWFRRDGGRPTA